MNAPQQFSTSAIVLSRVDYGEADRIITILTPDHGKLAVIAKGVRREKSKLAGGIELFSISDLTIIKGRGEIDTLTSSRLKTHYGNIVKDYERTKWAYEVLKNINKITEHAQDTDLFELLYDTLIALNDESIPFVLIQVWYDTRLLIILGHEPNLYKDQNGVKLESGKLYDFDLEKMCVVAKSEGELTPEDIKFLRLVRTQQPKVLSRIKYSADYAASWLPYTRAMSQNTSVFI